MQNSEPVQHSGSIFSNIDALRLSGQAPGGFAPEVLATIPVRKPKRHEFFRVHPDELYTLETTAYIDRQAAEVYMVTPEARAALAGEMKIASFQLAKTRQGVDFIIPVVLVTDDGRPLAWYESMKDAVTRAKRKWMRVAPDMNLGAYRIFEARIDLGEPVWPEKSFNELLEIAFRDKVIDTEDHPIIRQLRGLE